MDEIRPIALPRGRRPKRDASAPTSRASILDAARKSFLAEGYAKATVRRVATEAGVDVALVAYFFGSKRELFAAAMAFEVDPGTSLRSLLPGSHEKLGSRIVRRLVSVWDDPASGSPLRVLVAAAATEARAAVMLREYVQSELLDPLTVHLAGQRDVGDAKDRARRACVLLLGLIQARYILELEPLASAKPREIEDLFGGMLQHALDSPATGSS